jgi:two-component system cell cycle sensor histidine kinase/response regulator CckA
LIEVNPACLEIFGVESVDAVRGFDLFADPNVPPEASSRLEQGESVQYETMFDFELVRQRALYPTSRSGQFFVDCLITPLRAPDRSITGYLVHVRDITERKRAEEERLAHLRFLESMDQINRAIQGTNDLEQMMSDVLDEVLSIFETDRAFLGYPCDPQAPSWRIPMERTRPEYPGAAATKVKVPMSEDDANLDRALLASSSPVKFGHGPDFDHPLPVELTEDFDIQSQIIMAIYPKVGKPWTFGTHQCSHPRVWTQQEGRLLQEIGWRLADGLTSLLMFRSLRESEGKLAEAQCIAHVGYWERDINTDRITWSDETYRIFGLRPQERILSLAQLGELLHPEDQQIMVQAVAEALRGGPRYDVEYRVIRPNGEVRIVHSQGDVTWDKSGRPLRMFGTMQDITERKRAEEVLRESEEKYRELINGMNDTAWVIDFEGNFIDVNNAAVEVLGYSREELLSMGPHDIDNTLDAEEIKALIKEMPTDKIQVFETTHTTKDGKVIPVEIKSSLVTYLGKRAILSIARDITERKRAEEAVRQSEERFRALYEDNPSMYFMVDAQGTVLSVNPFGAEQLGYTKDELEGQSVLNVFYEEDKAAVSEQLKTCLQHPRQVYHWQFRKVRKDGSLMWVEEFARAVNGPDGVVYVLVVCQDITERKQLEAENEQLTARFYQAQKMEAIGRLAGGVAHDFNNLLTAIIGYSELLLDRLNPYDPRRSDVEEIKKAGDQAAALTRQLLAFSRKQVLQPQVLDLNATVSNMEKMLRRLIGEDIDLVTILAPDLGRVKADPGQVEQVLMNLAVNARDAMPQGGKLTIETMNAYLDENYARQHADVQPGPYVMLAVSDTGIGMDKETQSHLFEPFFTTKEVGKGTGLGLATIYGIVKQSDGHIWVYSELGQGTTFKIYLPRVEEAVEPGQRISIPVESLRGSETILLAEDADVVRDLARLALLQSGYTVLEARTGEEALLICERHEGPIHLLLTDVVMPGGMSGRQLAERLATLRPGMKVLYMSGYTDNAIAHHGVLEPGMAFLQKPFTPASLAHKVRETLDAP